MSSPDPSTPAPDFRAGAELLRALAHPARLQIAVELDRGDRCVHELVEALGLAQPTVSQHLQVLRAARVVTGLRVGREMRYSLTDHHVGHIALDALLHAGEPGAALDPDPHDDEPHHHQPLERTTP